jgi:adenylate cyclase class IV
VTPGDTIKLGRIEYRVIESQVGVNNLSVKKVAEAFKDDTFFDANNQNVPDTKEAKICRYCLSEECCPDKNSVDN